ncbi:hypothetical protein [Paludibaculum fermentans]|uniref:Uncharacterized protein n=1 Tax=Paludibaculum fermentans TaxID=1473598 RepID=A0A7S7NWX9_PALFE|nr:hypothetical protein [Paludibaculum fermentans]QOY91321.1 hypothetical protein IRI77_15640 [Paludibaculum fermentans]
MTTTHYLRVLPFQKLLLLQPHDPPIKGSVSIRILLSALLALIPACLAQTAPLSTVPGPVRTPRSSLAALAARIHSGANRLGPFNTRTFGNPDGPMTVAPASTSSPGTPVPATAPATVLPQFAFGGGWYSALYFTNVAASPVSFTASFISDAGSPLTVPALGGSAVQVNLPAHGTAVIEAPNSGSLVQGYAAFTLPSSVFGYGVFRQSVTGQLDQEAVVPLSDAGANSNMLTWDETNLTTAVAMANPSSSSATVVVTLWDEGGNTIGNYAFTLPPHNKFASVLRNLPGLGGMAGKRGSAHFTTSNGSIAVLGLRFNGLALTSIPATTGSSVSGTRSLVLPQIAFGGGWYSALYFTNTAESPVSFPVRFMTDGGAPLIVPSLQNSTVQVNLPAHGTAILEAPNSGALAQGFAAFTLPSGVSGYGVFRQSVPGQSDQEAVVPLSDAAAGANSLTWDETNLTTAVAMVNPSSTSANVDVTLWDNSGNTLGTSSIVLPPNNKSATVLRSLPGLEAMAGKRGSAQFTASSGSVAVLGLRFDGLALTSIPTTGMHAAAAGDLVAQHVLAQTGLAIGQASTVLQSQLRIVMAISESATYCTALEGGGSIKVGNSANAVTIYYDSYCTKPYLSTGADTTMNVLGDSVVISEAATYYGPGGSILGTMVINETAKIGSSSWNVYGLGTFTPATGARTPVQLGLYCSLADASSDCAGGIAQDFPTLGLSIGAVTPIRLNYGNSTSDPITFTGGGTAFTGPLGALTLTNPSPTTLSIQGGAAFSTTTSSGGAAGFNLFPPTPTAWTLTDSANDQKFQISVVSNTVRNLTLSIIQMSSGTVLATGALDQSGSGTITYSDGSTAVVTNWTLAN